MALSKQRVLGKALLLLLGAVSAYSLIALFFSWSTSTVLYAVLSILSISGLLLIVSLTKFYIFVCAG